MNHNVYDDNYIRSILTDVKSIAMDVLRHRVILSYEAEAEEKTPEDLVKQILDRVEVP